MHSSYTAFEKKQNTDEYTEEYFINSIQECDLLSEDVLCKLSDVIESFSRDYFKEEKDRMSVTDATAMCFLVEMRLSVSYLKQETI